MGIIEKKMDTKGIIGILQGLYYIGILGSI